MSRYQTNMDNLCGPGCVHEQQLSELKKQMRAEGFSELSLSFLSAHPWRLTPDDRAEVLEHIKKLNERKRK